jgi:hypothetical protein
MTHKLGFPFFSSVICFLNFPSACESKIKLGLLLLFLHTHTHTHTPAKTRLRGSGRASGRAMETRHRRHPAGVCLYRWRSLYIEGEPLIETLSRYRMCSLYRGCVLSSGNGNAATAVTQQVKRFSQANIHPLYREQLSNLQRNRNSGKTCVFSIQNVFALC